ncbi:hypothetical protein [Paenibacillus sp. JGP012]|uniref:hypothetical protein n=1 Tax=Paenibacillus sp. JGP012 TaxID=2735914 RepID=UPI001C885F2B|nr:hypothetical protein [Paenibacillus sp. JGP012]
MKSRSAVMKWSVSVAAREGHSEQHTLRKRRLSRHRQGHDSRKAAIGGFLVLVRDGKD